MKTWRRYECVTMYGHLQKDVVWNVRGLICLIAFLNLMLSQLMLNSKGPQNMTKIIWSPLSKFSQDVGQYPFDFLTDTLLSILLSILGRINAFPVILHNQAATLGFTETTV